jgi:hypothetical protein
MILPSKILRHLAEIFRPDQFKGRRPGGSSGGAGNIRPARPIRIFHEAH